VGFWKPPDSEDFWYLSNVLPRKNVSGPCRSGQGVQASITLGIGTARLFKATCPRKHHRSMHCSYCMSGGQKRVCRSDNPLKIVRFVVLYFRSSFHHFQHVFLDPKMITSRDKRNSNQRSECHDFEAWTPKLATFVTGLKYAPLAQATLQQNVHRQNNHFRLLSGIGRSSVLAFYASFSVLGILQGGTQ
jgi:hypothetical protein